jgi:hypothetical protein
MRPVFFSISILVCSTFVADRSILNTLHSITITSPTHSTKPKGISVVLFIPLIFRAEFYITGILFTRFRKSTMYQNFFNTRTMWTMTVILLSFYSRYLYLQILSEKSIFDIFDIIWILIACSSGLYVINYLTPRSIESSSPVFKSVKSTYSLVKEGTSKSNALNNFPEYPQILTNELTGESFLPNSVIDIDNNVFKGQLLIRMKSPVVPKSLTNFFEHRPQSHLEVSFQGKFKTKPKGVFFFGLESGHKIEISFFKRKILAIIRRICQSMARDMVLAFDDESVNRSPILVYPAFQMADVSVESIGEANVPKLSEIYKAKPNIDRNTVPAFFNIEPEHTYSISFYSDQLHLYEWKVVGLPALSDISLATLIGGSYLRLMAYEHLGSTSDFSHHPNNRKLLFSCKIENRTPDFALTSAISDSDGNLQDDSKEAPFHSFDKTSEGSEKDTPSDLSKSPVIVNKPSVNISALKVNKMSMSVPDLSKKKEYLDKLQRDVETYFSKRKQKFTEYITSSSPIREPECNTPSNLRRRTKNRTIAAGRNARLSPSVSSTTSSLRRGKVKRRNSFSVREKEKDISDDPLASVMDALDGLRVRVERLGPVDHSTQLELAQQLMDLHLQLLRQPRQEEERPLVDHRRRLGRGTRTDSMSSPRDKYRSNNNKFSRVRDNVSGSDSETPVGYSQFGERRHRESNTEKRKSLGLGLNMPSMPSLTLSLGKSSNSS